MSNGLPNNTEQVLSKDLNREILYKLFINDNAQSIDVDKIDMIDEEAQSSSKEREVRHRAEKLLFLNLLMDYDLENQIERRKNAKYDYMNGLLLYIASNHHFKYGFGYFKDNIQSFDNMLEQWCKFLNAVISDINALPIIQLEQQVVVEFGEILDISLSKNTICKVKIEMENFDRLFEKKDKIYDFCIRIDKEIFETGKSNGSGLQSNLYKAFSELNQLITTLSLKQQLLIQLTHEY